ncbi:hypothetical protein [Corynebacterium lizhenjunii]|uniref:VG15 protein n=1 Tax=Corynebacterium lizhenjunii TaxID=2709394 RepID=UPI0013EABCCD|nr:hypothetical protein [Corynebacterium lizhenjunii]
MSARDEYALALELLRMRAQQDFATWWAAKEQGRVTPEQLRAVFADITRDYGEVAASAAVDYLILERSLDESLAGLGFPDRADPVGFEQAVSSFDWAVNTSREGGVFDAVVARRKLDGVLVRLVGAPAHETVVVNARRDGRAFARVPEPGACAFCLMLASRGAVYASRHTAGAADAGTSFHDHCRCLVIECKRDGSDLPRINRDLEAAWAESGARNQTEFEKYIKLRGEVGGPPWPPLERVNVPEYAGDGTSKVFPGEPLPNDLNRAVAHVLYGWRDTPLKGGMWVKHSEDSRMGHTWDSQRAKASKFPKSWSNQKIADAVVETLENPEHYDPRKGKGVRKVYRAYGDLILRAEYSIVDGIVQEGSISAYPVEKLGRKAVQYGD